MTLRLEDDIDVSRGDMICRPHEPARAEAKEHRGDGLLDVRRARCRRRGRYRIKHTTPHRAGQGRRRCCYRIDVNTLHRDEDANALELNEIGRVRLRLSAPLLVDEYRRNRATGSFILIDESTNDTVGAGMVL